MSALFVCKAYAWRPEKVPPNGCGKVSVLKHIVGVRLLVTFVPDTL